MKITIKTTQQKVFQVSFPPIHPCHPLISIKVDVEGSDTVGILKHKIQETQGHAVAAQKIIYSGRLTTLPAR